MPQSDQQQSAQHPPRRTNDLLGRVRRMIGLRSMIPSFTGSAYMRGHVAFESSSGQQAQILAWLTADLCSATENVLSITSIGAGSGILDVPMLAKLAPVKEIDYLAVEPFAEQCRAFEKRAASALDSGNPHVEVVQATLEGLETERRFDRVLVIHSIYYVSDLAAALKRLLDLTAPGGEVIIAVAPREEMNRLAEVFWSPQQAGQVWFEEDVVREVKALGVEMTRERIDAHLVFDPEGPTALDIASFLIQCPLGSLDPAECEIVFDYLRHVGQWRGDQLAVPHPVSILRLRA